MPTNTAKQSTNPRIPRLQTSCLVVVLEMKGGVGKSAIAQLAVSAAELGGERVLVAETDHSNSNMAMVGLANYPTVNVREDGFVGSFLEIAEKLEKGVYEHAVVDTGAQEDALVQAELPRLKQHLDRAGIKLIVVRPITTSHFVQHNAIDYVKNHRPPGSGCVFVLNCSQGRLSKDYDEWRKTTARQQCLAAGVVEIEMASVGVVVADNAISLGLSFADIARGDFSRAGDDQHIAEAMFTRSRQLFVADFLLQHAIAFRQAF